MERRGGASSTAMEGDNHRAGQRGNRRNPGTFNFKEKTMTLSQIHDIIACYGLFGAMAFSGAILAGYCIHGMISMLLGK